MKKIQILVLLVLFAFVAPQVVAQEKKETKKETTECCKEGKKEACKEGKEGKECCKEGKKEGKECCKEGKEDKKVKK